MKTSIELIKTKLEAVLKGKIKCFYVGDPWIFPESYLPAIVISPERTETNVIDTQRDSNIHYMTVSLVIDARQFFGSKPNEMVGSSFLMETFEKEASDGTLDPSSVLYVIRKNMNLGSNRFVQNIESIEYTMRRRAEDYITLEAVLKLQVEHIVTRPV